MVAFWVFPTLTAVAEAELPEEATAELLQPEATERNKRAASVIDVIFLDKFMIYLPYKIYKIRNPLCQLHSGKIT
jgi:hypothetical protein